MPKLSAAASTARQSLQTDQLELFFVDAPAFELNKPEFSIQSQLRQMLKD
jgi:hypothetical protein